MANCSAVSVCGRISVQVTCLNNIYQGEDAEITLQFLDSAGAALDLNNYTNIIGLLYNEYSSAIATYTYPTTTDSYELTINDDGTATIFIQSALTSTLIAGKLFIEFKLNEVDTAYDNGVKTTIIPCLEIGAIQSSLFNSVTELPNVVVSNIIGVTSVDGLSGAVDLSELYLLLTGGILTGPLGIGISNLDDSIGLHIKAGELTSVVNPLKIEGLSTDNTIDKLLAITSQGIVVDFDISEISVESPVTGASNGLTLNSKTIELGGDLSKTTNINALNYLFNIQRGNFSIDISEDPISLGSNNSIAFKYSDGTNFSYNGITDNLGVGTTSSNAILSYDGINNDGGYLVTYDGITDGNYISLGLFGYLDPVIGLGPTRNYFTSYSSKTIVSSNSGDIELTSNNGDILITSNATSGNANILIDSVDGNLTLQAGNSQDLIIYDGLTLGTANQVLTSDGSKAYWADSSAASTIEVENGLQYLTSGEIALGGILNQDTVIQASEENIGISFINTTDGTVGETGFAIQHAFSSSGKSGALAFANFGFGDGLNVFFNNDSFTELVNIFIGDQSGVGGAEYQASFGYNHLVNGNQSALNFSENSLGLRYVDVPNNIEYNLYANSAGFGSVFVFDDDSNIKITSSSSLDIDNTSIRHNSEDLISGRITNSEILLTSDLSTSSNTRISLIVSDSEGSTNTLVLGEEYLSITTLQDVLDSTDAYIIAKEGSGIVKSEVTISEIIPKGVTTVTTTSTIAPDSSDKLYRVTALSEDVTLSAPSGDWEDGQDFVISIVDDSTSRAITVGADYRQIGVTVPSNTTSSKTIYIGMIYNSAISKFDIIGVSEEV
jgi:hypothetical protein